MAQILRLSRRFVLEKKGVRQDTSKGSGKGIRHPFSGKELPHSEN
jgi:hypothetical protein